MAGPVILNRNYHWHYSCNASFLFKIDHSVPYSCGGVNITSDSIAANGTTVAVRECLGSVSTHPRTSSLPNLVFTAKSCHLFHRFHFDGIFRASILVLCYTISGPLAFLVPPPDHKLLTSATALRFWSPQGYVSGLLPPLWIPCSTWFPTIAW